MAADACKSDNTSRMWRTLGHTGVMKTALVDESGIMTLWAIHVNKGLILQPTFLDDARSINDLYYITVIRIHSK